MFLKTLFPHLPVCKIIMLLSGGNGFSREFKKLKTHCLNVKEGTFILET